ncbi:MAG: sulfatase [Candidatus Sumerlaeota bacterium]|nr:sulfatase [Candidatus Sumerlaeota bacterium]
MPVKAKAPEVSGNRPNILIVLLDTASARFLSCYGYPKKNTPLMDRLAAEGARFAYCYGNGPWTPPAHASLFTGLPSIVHKINHDHINQKTKAMFQRVRFRGQFPTLASLLSDNGYQTVGICGNGWVHEKSNASYGFQFWDTMRRPDDQHAAPKQREMQMRGRSTVCMLEWADTKRDPSKPYFAFVNYLTPHLRRRPPMEYQKRFVKGPCPEYLHDITSLNCFGYLWNGVLKPEHMEAFKGLYAALMAQTDDQIKALLDGLKKRGMMDDTIVVITADHGDENGEHNLLDHQMCVYNTLIHVPLIFWHPQRMKAGRVENRPVQLSDVAPTLLDLAGLEKVRQRQKQMKGLDLFAEVPQLKGSRPIVSEHGVPRLIIRNAIAGTPTVTPEQYTPYLRRLKCIIFDGWKHIWGSDGRDELYNLKTDHAETANVIEKYPAKAKELRQRLERWVKSYGETLERDKRRPKP